MKFKTNIKCGGCVAKVTPHLNKTVGENKWDVDTENPRKILTIEGASEGQILQAIKEAGFEAEKI